MKKIPFLLLMTAVVFSACNTGAYKKAGDGMEYKVIADGKGAMVKQGDYMEFEIKSLVSHNGKDSVLNNSREQGAPQIIKIDSTGMPPSYYKLFLQLHKGDSLTTRTIVDSFFKKQPMAMPPFMHKGDYLFTNIRVTNIYTNSQDADKAREAGIAAQTAFHKIAADKQQVVDDKTLNDYFKANNITAVKTPKGAYVQILQQGSGPLPDTTNFVKINYTGRTLDGKMFDSNTDSAKGHVQPLLVNLTANMTLGGNVIPGMSDGLRMLNKGAKAKIYIPSSLGYGIAGAGADIGPNSNLIFEVEMLDIETTQQAADEKMAAQKKAMDMQKHYMDSVGKMQKAPINNAPAMQQHP